MNKLEDVYNAWQNNPQFRNEFKKNPEKALESAGLHLLPQDLEKIKTLLKEPIINEKLDKRISK